MQNAKCKMRETARTTISSFCILHFAFCILVSLSPPHRSFRRLRLHPPQLFLLLLLHGPQQCLHVHLSGLWLLLSLRGGLLLLLLVLLPFLVLLAARPLLL